MDTGDFSSRRGLEYYDSDRGSCPGRREILSLAHDNPLAGHLGVKKTHDRILCHFFWLKLKKDATCYCKSCDVCQVAGKPNQVIPPAPLYLIPVISESFWMNSKSCVVRPPDFLILLMISCFLCMKLQLRWWWWKIWQSSFYSLSHRGLCKQTKVQTFHLVYSSVEAAEYWALSLHIQINASSSRRTGMRGCTCKCLPSERSFTSLWAPASQSWFLSILFLVRRKNWVKSSCASRQKKIRLNRCLTSC